MARVQERKDGRQEGDIRRVAVERGLLNRADGSARWTQDRTCVLAAVYGPKAQTGKKENSDRAVLEVVFKLQSGVGGNAEREKEQLLSQALDSIVLYELNPRTGISIIVQVIADDGAALACSINAACAALVDAGAPLQGFLTSATCAVSAGGEILLDPTLEEQQAARAHVTLAFRGRASLPEEPQDALNEGAIMSFTDGPLSQEEYFACVRVCRLACSSIGKLLREGTENYQRAAARVEAAQSTKQ